jgi:hypothetical protein
MLVLMDIEWIIGKRNELCPTQFAALRVDSSWNVLNDFSALVKPRDNRELWGHVAYSG